MNNIFNQIGDSLSSIYDSFKDFFDKLFKPPSSLNDYYSIGKLMISKNIARIIFLVITLIASIYLILTVPEKIMEYYQRWDGNRIYTKYYNSRSLRKFNGVAKIITKKSDAKYIGDIVNGVANGNGTLYDKNNRIVYDGDFIKNEYSGNGMIYFNDGSTQYIGEFKSNLFNGKGKLFYPNHKINYEGDFIDGLKNGKGVLYDKLGSQIFNGVFIDDKPDIEQYLNQSIDQLKDVFLEDSLIYNYEKKTCVFYHNLGIMLALSQNSNLVKESSQIEKIYVLDNTYFLNEPKLDKIKLDKKFVEINGVREYNGYTRVLFFEMSIIDFLRKNNSDLFESFSNYDFNNQYADVFTSITGRSNDKIYIQAYSLNGLTYTFYFSSKDSPYVFYSIGKVS